MADIQTREDIDTFIRAFYGKVVGDESLSPFFKNFDFEGHIPRMVDFWSFLLLDQPGYTGNVIEKHIGMPLEKEHFDRWAHIFEETLDNLFEGEKVKLAKEKLVVLKWTMENKVLPKQ